MATNLPTGEQAHAITIERIDDRIAITIAFRLGNTIARTAFLSPSEARDLAGELLAASTPRRKRGKR